MTQSFDLVVLGVGMAAVSAANKCAKAGWSVAVVDELRYGGTCTLRGCDPKKMRRPGAKIIDATRLMRGKGIEKDDIRIHWPDFVAFKRSYTGKMPGRIEGGLQEEGVATVHGPAKLLKENTVEIGCGTQLQGRHILIATDAMPRPLDAPCAGHMSDNTQFMDLEQLPGRIVFVDGDYISFEFAHIAARAGSKVSIIDWATGPSSHSTPISSTNWSNAVTRQASTFVCGQRCNR